MIFDFDTFSNIAEAVFPSSPYSLEAALAVFKYYFFKYEECIGKAHPPIKTVQIVRIIDDMPWLSDKHTKMADISPSDYVAIIDQHFRTKYRRCDYNINHFFSGKVRELRFFEVCY